jgi:hypothetical protein
MPPASLSTLPVTIPGPRTARKSKKVLIREFSLIFATNFMRRLDDSSMSRKKF